MVLLRTLILWFSSSPNPIGLQASIAVPVVSWACPQAYSSLVPLSGPSSVPHMGYCRDSLRFPTFRVPPPLAQSPFHVTVGQKAALGPFFPAILVLLTPRQVETESPETAKDEMGGTFTGFTKISYLSCDGKPKCLTGIIN